MCAEWQSCKKIGNERYRLTKGYKNRGNLRGKTFRLIRVTVTSTKQTLQENKLYSIVGMYCHGDLEVARSVICFAQETLWDW